MSRKLAQGLEASLRALVRLMRRANSCPAAASRGELVRFQNPQWRAPRSSPALPEYLSIPSELSVAAKEAGWEAVSLSRKTFPLGRSQWLPYTEIWARCLSQRSHRPPGKKRGDK